MTHAHGSGGHAPGRAEDRARLRWVLAVTGVVLVVEVVGAWVTGSLALLADAGHMATDAAAVVLALGASYVATRPAGPRSTFGCHRAEILAALVNALVLLGRVRLPGRAPGSRRLLDPGRRSTPGRWSRSRRWAWSPTAVSLAVLNRSDTRVAEPARRRHRGLRRPARLGAGRGRRPASSGRPASHRADPIASLLIAVLILPRALVAAARRGRRCCWRSRPPGWTSTTSARHLLGMPGVVDVHDLHAWTITSGMPSLSAHVTVTDEALAPSGVGAHPGPALRAAPPSTSTCATRRSRSSRVSAPRARGPRRAALTRAYDPRVPEFPTTAVEGDGVVFRLADPDHELARRSAVGRRRPRVRPRLRPR